MTPLEEELSSFVGHRLGTTRRSPDPVNTAMIRHWAEVMGDDNPIYRDGREARAAGRSGIVAPPPMLQVWTMPGYRPTVENTRHDPVWSELLSLLEARGYTAIVATNSEHDYQRELSVGEQIHHTETIESISSEKRTALGTGFFITTVLTYADEAGEEVGRARFRVLISRPAEPSGPAGKRPQPPEGIDAAFWFDGVRNGRLLVQRCADCHAVRHPPGPVCPICNSLAWEAIESTGRGHVYSYVINHHPQAPGFEYPLPVVLAEMDEGFRLVAGFTGTQPHGVRIGMPVQVEFFSPQDGLTLPRFRLADESELAE